MEKKLGHVCIRCKHAFTTNSQAINYCPACFDVLMKAPVELNVEWMFEEDAGD